MTQNEKKKISFVIPCYKSAGSVGLVIDEIHDVISERPEYDYEVIAVNDCSPDDTLDVIRAIAETNERVIAVDLAKNGGKHSALMCGCHFATGDYVAFVDDDQQCPLDRFWDLLAPLVNDVADGGGYDVAIARYPKKTQSAWKNLGSKFNDAISTWLLSKDPDLKFSNFSVMKRFVRDEVVRYTNPYPYLAGLMVSSTKRVCNVDMEERERTIGEGNYNFKKSVSLWTNSLTSFSVKPLRLATVCGFVLAVLGIIFALVVIIRKILHPIVAVGYSSTMAALLFIGGMIMIMLGLIGEYIGRIYISLNNSPQFVIRNVYGNEPKPGDDARGSDAS